MVSEVKAEEETGAVSNSTAVDSARQPSERRRGKTREVCNTFVFGNIAGRKAKLQDRGPTKRASLAARALHTSSETESIDSYVTHLKNKVKACEFGGLRDSVVHGRIVCGVAAWG